MLYKTIQGNEVPALGFGTYRLTGRACRDGVEDALSIGYRHIDTAQAYNNEAEVGRAIRNGGVARDEIFLTTKLWMDNLDPESVRSSTEESLRKLQTDAVDLLLIHWPTDTVPLQDTLEAMVDLQKAGRTRHVGVSNFTPDLVEKAFDHASIFCNQVEYHPFLSQQALLDLAAEGDFLLTAYSPIARGQVRDAEILQQIGSEHGKSPVQVTLRWLIQQNNVAPIPKASSADHRRQNFDIFDFELSDEEMQRIASLARGDRIVDPGWAPAWP